MDCGSCAEFKKLNNKKTTCAECERYTLSMKLDDKQKEIVNILVKHSSIMLDSMGGIDSYGLLNVLKMYGMCDDTILYITTLCLNTIIKMNQQDE